MVQLFSSLFHSLKSFESPMNSVGLVRRCAVLFLSYLFSLCVALFPSPSSSSSSLRLLLMFLYRYSCAWLSYAIQHTLCIAGIWCICAVCALKLWFLTSRQSIETLRSSVVCGARFCKVFLFFCFFFLVCSSVFRRFRLTVHIYFGSVWLARSSHKKKKFLHSNIFFAHNYFDFVRCACELSFCGLKRIQIYLQWTEIDKNDNWPKFRKKSIWYQKKESFESAISKDLIAITLYVWISRGNWKSTLWTTIERRK